MSYAPFAESVLLDHHYKALPVIGQGGAFLGMVGLDHLRKVPMRAWPDVQLGHVMDSRARTLCPDHTARDAERALRHGLLDYVPVVDPSTYQLVGVVSSSDVDQARLLRTQDIAS